MSTDVQDQTKFTTEDLKAMGERLFGPARPNGALNEEALLKVLEVLVAPKPPAPLELLASHKDDPFVAKVEQMCREAWWWLESTP